MDRLAHHWKGWSHKPYLSLWIKQCSKPAKKISYLIEKNERKKVIDKQASRPANGQVNGQANGQAYQPGHTCPVQHVQLFTGIFTPTAFRPIACA